MKKKGMTLAASAVLLGCLFGAYAFLRIGNQTAQKESEAEENAPILTMDTENITSLCFAIGDTQAEFDHTDEGWILKEDETFPVNEESIALLLEDLAALPAVRTLTGIEDVSEYGFEEPQNSIAFTDAEGNETTLVIGATNQGTGDDYMMLDGDTSVVYTIGSALRTSISEELYDYARSESLPIIYSTKVNGVTVEQGEGGYRLYQEDDVWYVENEEGETAEADEDAVEAAISTVLNSLNYKDFLEHNCQDGTAYGLGEDAWKLTIFYQEEAEAGTENSAEDSTEVGTENGAEQKAETGNAVQEMLTFRIGNKDANEDYYVQMEGSGEVHTLSGAILSELLDVPASEWVKEEEETESEVETESEAETKNEAKAESEEETGSEAKAESEVEPESGTETD